MAAFDDFLRQHLMTTNRGYTTDPNGTPVLPPQVQPITTVPMQPTPMPVPTPMGMAGNQVVGDGTGGAPYRDPNGELAALLAYLKIAGGVDTGTGFNGADSPASAQMPSVPPQGAIPGAPWAPLDPGALPYNTVVTPSGGGGNQSGLSRLIADAKSVKQGGTYEDGSSDPSYVMSAGSGGYMNDQVAHDMLQRMRAENPSVSPMPVSSQTVNTGRGPMNPIQQAAAIALAKLKGMQ